MPHPSRENIFLDMALPLPLPGPDHYAARRARWLTATNDSSPAPPRQSSQSLLRLHRLLAHPDAHSDHVWNNGVDKVWNGLIKGNRLKHPLPMTLVIKVIHAAWRRDPDTWPENALAPDSDESRPP